jgi:putative phosphoserine phosphatase/1-acylglycerol-3-phosphate O-acyltransferase
MTTLAELLAAIDAAPPGPTTMAVFDYDGTLIDGYSAATLYKHRLRSGDIGPTEAIAVLVASVRGIRDSDDFDAFLATALKAFGGRDESELFTLGQKLFTKEIAARLRPETWELAQAHRRAGHTVVMASSATRFQVEPMAREVGADHICCTELEVGEGGLLTGAIVGKALWGPEKAAAVIELARAKGCDLSASFAYSDGDEDVPLLEAVGNSTAVSPQPHLAEVATERGWNVLDASDRSSPVAAGLLRNLAFYGGFATGLTAAAGVGLVHQSRRKFLDTAISVGSDLGLGLGGIEVDVVSGHEHIWSARPCVFLFNHQSNLDAFVIMHVLRGGFTAVVKKELASYPLWGQLFQFGGAAFVDRSNHQEAMQALAPAVEKLREGVSLVVAPEGTRSATPKLGPFKKGAFHIARQAKVPVVPIVVKGAGQLMPRGEHFVRPGRVEVVVLPPIDVMKWPKDFARRVEKVRQQYIDVLGDWPG